VAVVERSVVGLAVLLAAIFCLSEPSRSQEQTSAPPTFTKDVAPILQKHCQTCHRPGEAAPFAMLTYEDTLPWAAVMKMVVTRKIMPPWFADPRYGHFANERALSADEIRTLAAWVNGGARKGATEDMPPAMKDFVPGWGIPTPDVVFQLPNPFSVPATGVIDYQYVIVPTGFTEDKWVQALEVRPTDRAVVHHIIAYLREPGSDYFKDQKPGVFFTAPPKTDDKTDTSALPSDFLVGYAPGQPAEILRAGEGKLIKAGSDIVFEVHYTPNGKPTTDRTKLGLVLSKSVPKARILTLSASNGTFKIPPGDPDYQVDASFEVQKPVTLVGLHPHMHARGKSFEYRLTFPDGKTETILSVPAYNWHWQLWYNLADPIDLPQGTKIECTAHFDNSPNNPENPDPAKAVIWGQQSWDEMMVGFFNLKFDAAMPAKEISSPGAIHVH
jgi:mono/diheme cytochrome c family protein